MPGTENGFGERAKRGFGLSNGTNKGSLLGSFLIASKCGAQAARASSSRAARVLTPLTAVFSHRTIGTCQVRLREYFIIARAAFVIDSANDTLIRPSVISSSMEVRLRARQIIANLLREARIYFITNIFYIYYLRERKCVSDNI